MTIQHAQIYPGEVHVPYNYTYANASARIVATGLTASDVGKFARQLDDNSVWMLTNNAPIEWTAVGTGGSLDASQVAFEPDGAIISTDVQAAMIELDSEKASRNHNHPPAQILIDDGQGGTIDLTGALNLKADASKLGAANGIATLGADQKIPSNQLPALAITDTFVVASEIAMLALSGAEMGDVAVRTDLSKSFILQGTDPSDIADWQELLTPDSGVISFNGRSGAVSPGASDYTADQIGYNGTLSASYVEGALNELDADKAETEHVHAASVVTFSPVGGLSSTSVQGAIAELENNKTNTGHEHVVADISDINTALNTRVAVTDVGADNGVAPLDSNGLVPSQYLPAASGGDYTAEQITLTSYDDITGANVQIGIQQLAAQRIKTSAINAANGVAGLDSGGKVAISQLPDSILGAVQFQGTWNATTNSPTLPSAGVNNKGFYYKVSVAGTYQTVAYALGDWVISDGTAWSKVDTAEAVPTVFGRTGAIVATDDDYTASQVTNVPAGHISATDVQGAVDELANDIGDLAANPLEFIAPAVLVNSGGVADIAHQPVASVGATTRLTVHVDSDPVGTPATLVRVGFGDSTGQISTLNLTDQGDGKFEHWQDTTLSTFNSVAQWVLNSGTIVDNSGGGATALETAMPMIDGSVETLLKFRYEEQGGYTHLIIKDQSDTELADIVGSDQTYAYVFSGVLNTGGNVTVEAYGFPGFSTGQTWDGTYDYVVGRTVDRYSFFVTLQGGATTYIGQSGVAYASYPLTSEILPGDTLIGTMSQVLSKSVVGLFGTSAPNATFFDNKVTVYDMLGVAKSKIELNASNLTALGNTVSANQGTMSTHIGNTANPHSTTKAHVGLGNVTNDAQIPLAQKGAASGVASLDASGKVPLTQIPESIATGAVSYQGTWNATTNTPTLPTAASGNKGYYYKVSVAGTYQTIDFEIGDWVISNGIVWDCVDTSDAVSSVFGRSGAIVAADADYTAAQVVFDPADATGMDSGKTRVQGAVEETWNTLKALSERKVVVLKEVAGLSSGTSNNIDVTASITSANGFDGSLSALGVICTAPSNRVALKDSAGLPILAPNGSDVYGRLTKTTEPLVVTLTFYYLNDSSVETLFAFAANTSLVALYRETLNLVDVPADMLMTASGFVDDNGDKYVAANPAQWSVQAPTSQKDAIDRLTNALFLHVGVTIPILS